jgi:SAM-dependent methyltransferase
MGGEEGYFGERVAAVYDEHSATMFDPAVVEPAVERLAELADGGAALEFAIGTGRIALPLSGRGVTVAGIDNSDAMLARLRQKPGADRIHAIAGDMAATRVEGDFSLVYLVFNTIFNLTSQDGQVACFENAARHLTSGGRFVIEARVPEVQRLGFGNTVLPWRADPTGLSFYVYDVVTQRLSGQHYYLDDDDGALRPSPTEMRYAWPAELDLMARLAGMRLEHRWANWQREPFTAISPAHVSVYRKP